MDVNAIRALVVTDIRLYLADRRAVLVGVVVPILIAAFFGYVFRGDRDNEDRGRIPVAIVDEDGSDVSRAITADLAADSLLKVTPLNRDAARDQVKSGAQDAATVFPRGYGESATRALFGGRNRPQVALLTDPSRSMSARVVEGLLAQYSLQEISRQAFAGKLGLGAIDDALGRLDGSAEARTPMGNDVRQLLSAAKRLNERRSSDPPEATDPDRGFGLRIPYTVAATPVTARDDVPYNGYAHSFAGMSVQFILFAGIDAGVLLLLTRQRGIWQRIRSAPLGRGDFMLARVLATTLISAGQFGVIYLAALTVFSVRIEGSVAGFLAIALAFCLLNATFGVLLATLGRSPAATRGLSMMIMLMLVMLGGAWVPAFVFPRWLQTASLYTPTRWAVDGLDAMTWRGLPWSAAVGPVAVLLAGAALCLAVAIARFRWEQ